MNTYVAVSLSLSFLGLALTVAALSIPRWIEQQDSTPVYFGIFEICNEERCFLITSRIGIAVTYTIAFCIAIISAVPAIIFLILSQVKKEEKHLQIGGGILMFTGSVTLAATTLFAIGWGVGCTTCTILYGMYIAFAGGAITLIGGILSFLMGKRMTNRRFQQTTSNAM